jgi:hypothetical protein
MLVVGSQAVARQQELLSSKTLTGVLFRSTLAPFELKDHYQIPFGRNSAQVVSIAASSTGEHVTAMSSVGETYLLYPNMCHDDVAVDQIIGEVHLDDRVCPLYQVTQAIPKWVDCAACKGYRCRTMYSWT